MRRSRFAFAGAVAVAVAIAALAAGCSASSGPPHVSSSPVPAATQLPPPRATCGTSHTAVDVPVVMEVEKGSVACQMAMQIQDSYTTLVRSGKVPGNGGGAPVKVDGWICQGADTTTTVQTGEASECTKDGTEIVAVLKLGNASGSPSGG
ncbi:MAG TPA: hypothetical protein VGI74_16295 [Streptosporangiaceae bacterium]